MSKVPPSKVRQVFPEEPTTFDDAGLDEEILDAAYKIGIAAWKQRYDEMCVWMVRLQELIGEHDGKPFDHGDHWQDEVLAMLDKERVT
jgi:hypothetical protein